MRAADRAVGRARPALQRPRLAFVGTGWIGLNRMEAVMGTGAADVVAVVDPDADAARRAADASGAAVTRSLDAVLDVVDGVVIATPSALHAEQAQSCLEAGRAVFVQKPLARTATEAVAIVAAAQTRDLPLGVDLSYRHVRAVLEAKAAVDAGRIGTIYAAELTFHNAYGPDKAWFKDPRLSGGGCLIDLGTHLVDLALWTFGSEVTGCDARLFNSGIPLGNANDEVEDHATARLDFASGGTASIACSWFLPAAQDALIRAAFYGTRGAVEVANVGGSFYDFRATLLRERGSVEPLAEPPDDWGGRAINRWVAGLANGEGFDAEAGREHVRLAETIDALYGRTT